MFKFVFGTAKRVHLNHQMGWGGGCGECWYFCQNWYVCQNWYFCQIWYFCQNWYFSQILYFCQNWYFCQIWYFWHLCQIITFSTFDIFINCFWYFHQHLIFMSIIEIFINFWLKHQLVVPVNCNFASLFWTAAPLMRKMRK